MYAICMRQRGHFQAARHFHALHACGSVALSVFHALHACGSAGTFSLSLSRQRCGTWACRRRRFAGLQRVRVCWSLFEFVGVCVESGGLSRAARVCGPAVLRPCGCGLCCHAVSDACARPGTAPHHLLAAATREVALVALVFLSAHLSLVALEAWRWRLGAGGLALEASWPVAMRRRALGAVPPVLVALGAAWLGVACGVVSAGFGCRGPKKRRRADTEDEDTRKRPAAGSATWRHVLVRLHTRFVRCALLEHKPHELHELPELTS